MDKKDKKEKHEDWKPPRTKPSKEEKWKMLGKAMEILVIEAMENHVYSFGKEIKIQSEAQLGGALVENWPTASWWNGTKKKS